MGVQVGDPCGRVEGGVAAFGEEEDGDGAEGAAGLEAVQRGEVEANGEQGAEVVPFEQENCTTLADGEDAEGGIVAEGEGVTGFGGGDGDAQPNESALEETGGTGGVCRACPKDVGGGEAFDDIRQGGDGILFGGGDDEVVDGFAEGEAAAEVVGEADGGGAAVYQNAASGGGFDEDGIAHAGVEEGEVEVAVRSGKGDAPGEGGDQGKKNHGYGDG